MKQHLALFFTVIIVLYLLSGCSRNLTEDQLYSQAADQEQRAVDYESQGKTAEAADLFKKSTQSYEKLVTNYPESEKAPEVLYKLGTAYLNNLKDPQKSVDTYRRLIEQYPDSKYVIQSYFMIGFRYANDIKDLDKAKEAYSLFLEKYPENELAVSVKWELENLGKDISEIEFLDDTTPKDKK